MTRYACQGEVCEIPRPKVGAPEERTRATTAPAVPPKKGPKGGPMEALVTGATGFIGSHVARALAEDGWTVRCLARSGSPRELLDDVAVTWVEGDLGDEAIATELERRRAYPRRLRSPRRW